MARKERFHCRVIGFELACEPLRAHDAETLLTGDPDPKILRGTRIDRLGRLVLAEEFAPQTDFVFAGRQVNRESFCNAVSRDFTAVDLHLASHRTAHKSAIPRDRDGDISARCRLKHIRRGNAILGDSRRSSGRGRCRRTAGKKQEDEGESSGKAILHGYGCDVFDYKQSAPN